MLFFQDIYGTVNNIPLVKNMELLSFPFKPTLRNTSVILINIVFTVRTLLINHSWYDCSNRGHNSSLNLLKAAKKLMSRGPLPSGHGL